MSDASNSVPRSVSERVKTVCTTFEEAWKAGRKTRIEELIAARDEPERSTVLRSLLIVELELLSREGITPDEDSYKERFPEDVDVVSSVFQHRHATLGERSSTASRSASPRSPIDTGALSERDTLPPNFPVDAKASGRGEFSPQQTGSIPSEFGRYRILKLLGEGAMGSVFLAHDSELDRKVALKTPKFRESEGDEVIERFYREARSSATLRNANICPIYDVGEIAGTRYISMAYIEGRRLSDYVASGKQLPQRQIALVVRKLALALQDAHDRGVVHRDLKPANIMIDDKHEPIIMDFGLARQIDQKEDERLTQEGMIVGSPAYMSPEQVEGKWDRIGPATDIYSLGVVLYELLAGQTPFKGSIAFILGQIVSQSPPKPSESHAGIDPHL